MNRPHEQTIAEHIAANVAFARDVAHEYRDPYWTAADAYAQNTRDSVAADGYSADDAFAAGISFLMQYRKSA